MKIWIWVGLIIIMVSFGAYFFIRHNSSLINQNTKVTVTDTNEWQEVTYEYPAGNIEIKKHEEDLYNNWKKESGLSGIKNYQEAKEKLFLIPDMKYMYTNSYTIATGTNNSLSYIYTTYTFTGGAHGSQNTHVYVYKNGKELTVQDIIPDSKLQQVATYVTKEALQELKKRSEGMEPDMSMATPGLLAKRENYSIAWYEGDDIVVYLGQYQIAAYVYGDFEIHIPRTIVDK